MKRLLPSLLLCLPLGCSGSDGDGTPQPDASVVTPTPDAEVVVVPDAAPPADAGPPDGPPGPPVIIQPEGPGTTLDLRGQSCLDLDVTVTDPDSAHVLIRQVQPVIEFAVLTLSGDLSATWQWCPTPAQVAFTDRWTLLLSADDGMFDPVMKSYVITLRRP